MHMQVLLRYYSQLFKNKSLQIQNVTISYLQYRCQFGRTHRRTLTTPNNYHRWKTKIIDSISIMAIQVHKSSVMFLFDERNTTVSGNFSAIYLNTKVIKYIEEIFAVSEIIKNC